MLYTFIIVCVCVCVCACVCVSVCVSSTYFIMSKQTYVETRTTCWPDDTLIPSDL